MAEFIQEGDKTLCSEIHNLIHYIWNKEELPQWWKESITAQISKNDNKIDSSNYQLS
jgi:hypothetical protein